MDLLYKIARRLEHEASLFQGKGYGTATITQEVSLAVGKLDSAPGVFLDIGANIGDYSAAIRSKFPHCQIHMFEPSATNILALRSRFADDNNAVIVPSAAAETTGQGTLYFDAPGSGLASLSKRRLDHFGIDFSGAEPIDMIRIEDYWIATLNRGPIDLVKIDVEGHELSVLYGFGDALAKTRIIQFEFGGCNIDTRTYFQDFWYFFKAAGFDLFRISPAGAEPICAYREIDEHFRTTNYLAIRS